jgi:hypothetical protein
MRIPFASLVAVCLAAACATPAKPDPTAMAAADTGEKKICKSMPVMGSNFPKRVCSTAEEWKKFEEETYKSVEAFDRDRKTGNTQGTFEGQ